MELLINVKILINVKLSIKANLLIHVKLKIQCRCEPNDHGRSTAKYEPIDHCGTNTQCVALFDHENMTDRSNSESVGGRFNRICLNSFHPTVL